MQPLTDTETTSNCKCNITYSQSYNIYPDKHEKRDFKNKNIDAGGKNDTLNGNDRLMFLRGLIQVLVFNLSHV